jgi:hypothetical protein
VNKATSNVINSNEPGLGWQQQLLATRHDHQQPPLTGASGLLAFSTLGVAAICQSVAASTIT